MPSWLSCELSWIRNGDADAAHATVHHFELLVDDVKLTAITPVLR